MARKPRHSATTVELSYGHEGRFSCEIDDDRLVAYHPGPVGSERTAEDLREALAAPLDFPPLEQLCIPGDCVALALDRHTPAAAELIAGIWDVLARRGVEPEGLRIVQPIALDGVTLVDPRSKLPDGVRERIRWTIHDATDEKQQAYLATTARGDRIYLNREVTEADVVIPVGSIGYDPVIGYRGTSSVFYPGLSSIEAITRAHSEGHSELGPHDERPLRQTIDEIAWLLGVQFTVQVIPGPGHSAAAVLAGTVDSVFREGIRRFDELWRVRLFERAETVVVAIDADTAGHGWDQLGAALATARSLVTRGGRVIVLSEISAEPGDGMNLIRQSRSSRNALQPIRKQAPLDMISAAQLAIAADWARIYLLSKLPGELVDELFMTPLTDEGEVHRLLAGAPPSVFIGSTQHAWGEIWPP